MLDKNYEDTNDKCMSRLSIGRVGRIERGMMIMKREGSNGRRGGSIHVLRNIYRKDLTKSVVIVLSLDSSSLLNTPSFLMVANTSGSLVLRWERKSRVELAF